MLIYEYILSLHRHRSVYGYGKKRTKQSRGDDELPIRIFTFSHATRTGRFEPKIFREINLFSFAIFIRNLLSEMGAGIRVIASTTVDSVLLRIFRNWIERWAMATTFTIDWWCPTQTRHIIIIMFRCLLLRTFCVHVFQPANTVRYGESCESYTKHERLPPSISCIIVSGTVKAVTQ